MEHIYKAAVVFLIFLLASLPVVVSGSMVIRCEQCTKEQPCATLFEFENLKFVHYVSCRIDQDGREQWSSKDKEKFDMFYFEAPGNAVSRDKMKI